MDAFVVGAGVKGAAVPTRVAVGATAVATMGTFVVGAGVIGAPVAPASDVGAAVGAAVATQTPDALIILTHIPLLQTHLLF